MSDTTTPTDAQIVDAYLYLFGRLLVAPAELPVGIVTAVVGAPVFALLLRRERLS